MDETAYQTAAGVTGYTSSAAGNRMALLVASIAQRSDAVEAL